MKHLSLTAFGKVQGVFFRASIQEAAKNLQVTGFTQNNPDGSVTVEAEGEPETLQKLVDWVKKGTATARVDRVEFLFHDQLENFQNFKIQ